MKLRWKWIAMLAVWPAVLTLQTAQAQTEKTKPEVYYVPARVDAGRHIVVRARINGKGPWSFVLDTGAPGLVIAPEMGAQLGIKGDADRWGVAAKLEIEGGPTLENVRTYLLPGITAIGAGVLGYSVLANYRIDIDPSFAFMVWTRKDWQPPRPLTRRELGMPGQSSFGGGGFRQPKVLPLPNQPHPGYLGIELQTASPPVTVAAVHPGSPAEKAGVKPGDVIIELNSHPVQTTEDVAYLGSQVRDGSTVNLKIQRDGQSQTLNVVAVRGF